MYYICIKLHFVLNSSHVTENYPVKPRSLVPFFCYGLNKAEKEKKRFVSGVSVTSAASYPEVNREPPRSAGARDPVGRWGVKLSAEVTRLSGDMKRVDEINVFLQKNPAKKAHVRLPRPG